MTNSGTGHRENLPLRRHARFHRVSHQLLGVVAEVRRRNVLVQQRDDVTGTRVRLQGLRGVIGVETDEQVLAEEPLRVLVPRGVEQEWNVEEHDVDPVLTGHSRHNTVVAGIGRGQRGDLIETIARVQLEPDCLAVRVSEGSPLVDKLLDEPQSSTGAGHSSMAA